MESKAVELCSDNLLNDENSKGDNLDNLNSLCDCQNSNQTVSNDHSNDKSDIRVLTNSLEKTLSVNHNTNTLPNGVSYDCDGGEIEYVSYRSELQMPDIMRLIQKDLSEPYSIYTYRYFIHNWPKLCFLAVHNGECVGAVVCKLDVHRKSIRRGYIAMLAVDQNYRKRKIGSNLVLKAIRAMSADNADEVVLETEITNHPALKLYENLGFVRDKRLFRYYLNGVDALRLKLWLR
ncbi:N-alpha-acetyltransferase 30 [Polyplax serrata]|uniref:N-terminal methionine N(alpha)-acetyltransferase NatC n=1 Tax=Polyplax serrata TaxID=468196 RepID=A0AAN8S0G0_POLSC